MQVPKQLCSDCEGLKNGTTSWPGPHEYLVSTDSAGHLYQCLICDTHFAREDVERIASWTVVAPSAGVAKDAPASTGLPAN